MRRLRGVCLSAVLAGAALVPACAFGGLMHSNGFSSNVPDLTSALALRFFGEVDDDSATAAAAVGDASSESPLRDMAFRVSFVPRTPYPALHIATGLSQPAEMPLPAPTILVAQTLRVPAFSAPRYAADDSAFAPPVASADTPAPVDAGIQNFRPSSQPALQRTPPSTVSLRLPSLGQGNSLTTFTPNFTPANAFDAGADEPGSQGALTGTGANLTVPVAVNVGAVHLRGHVEGGQSEAPALSLQTQAMGAGADVKVHALRHDLQFNVGGTYEHLSRNDAVPLASSSFDTTSTLQLAPNGLVPIPAYADLSKHTVSAGVAVPITPNLTVGAHYDQQHLMGGYGVQGVSNVDARNDIYGGNVTFNLPHNPAASISLSAKQYHFQDNIIPSNAFTQTRADLNFTVKFH